MSRALGSIHNMEEKNGSVNLELCDRYQTEKAIALHVLHDYMILYKPSRSEKSGKTESR